MPTRPGRRKSAYHHGDLRRALIDHALGLVSERGVAGLTLREAARRAGVSQAAPYRHFPDKAALVAAVAEEGFRELLARVGRALSRAPGDPLGRLQALAAAYVRMAVDQPARFRLMFGRDVAESHGHAGLWAAAQENFAVLTNEVQAAQRSGIVHGSDPRRAALAVWSLVHGLALLMVDGLAQRQGLGGGRSVEALAREVVGALADGLGQRRGRGGG